jgi:hypothetical protein
MLARLSQALARARALLLAAQYPWCVKLRMLLVVAAAVFVVSAITFAALVPSNFDSRDPSPVYTGAWWLAIASLLVLVVGALIALVRRFAKPSSEGLA